MRQIIWRQIQVTIPDEWEMLQFSRNPEFGTCAFADRYQFRLEVSWRVIAGRPDFDRMISDYRSRLVEEQFTDLRTQQRAGWRGVQGRREGQLTSRYGNHFPELNLLVELVFLWPADRDADLEKRVLRGTRAVPADADGLAHWHVFGMDVHVDCTLDLDRCTAEPGFQELRFRNRKRFVEQRVARHGMVHEWLRKPVGDWLQSQVPKGYSITGRRRNDQAGHEIVWLRGERARSNLRELIRGRRDYITAAWLCPATERLFTFHHIGLPAAGKGGVQPAARLRLGCCPGMEVTP